MNTLNTPAHASRLQPALNVYRAAAKAADAATERELAAFTACNAGALTMAEFVADPAKTKANGRLADVYNLARALTAAALADKATSAADYELTRLGYSRESAEAVLSAGAE